MGFDVQNDCPYNNERFGFSYSKVEYNEETKQVEGIFGPFDEFYTLVKEFAH